MLLSIIGCSFAVCCQFYIFKVVKINFISSVFWDNQLLLFVRNWCISINHFWGFGYNVSRFPTKSCYRIRYFLCRTIPIIIYCVLNIWANVFRIKINIRFSNWIWKCHCFTLKWRIAVPCFQCVILSINRFRWRQR